MVDLLTSIGNVIAMLVIIGGTGVVVFFVYWLCTFKDVNDANERELEKIAKGDYYEKKDNN